MGIKYAEFYAEHNTIEETAKKFTMNKLHTKTQNTVVVNVKNVLFADNFAQHFFAWFFGDFVS